MKIYIAGPYTGGDVVANVRSAITAGQLVMDRGHTPFVPHLNHFWHHQIPGAYEQWMRLDLAWLESCDALIRLSGDSPGADREVQRAEELGIPVFTSFAQIPDVSPGVGPFEQTR